MFLSVFQQAQTISQATDGAFDITVAPLVNIWGFGFKSGMDPSRHAIDSLMQFVGYQKVKYDGKHIVKQDSRVMLDCSAIAKGYGTDVVAQVLDEKGVKNYYNQSGATAVTWASDNYITESGNKHSSFGTTVTVPYGYTVAPYSDVPETVKTNAGATLFTGAPTGINGVIGTQPSDKRPFYNLSGQRVSASYKGILIVNGRKVVMK
jgi:hypothetical protein